MAIWHELSAVAPGAIAAALAGLLGVVGVGAIASGRAGVRGTTLFAPWCWALLAIACVAGGELVLWRMSAAALATWAGPVRYAAAMTTLTPIVAVLGAKRPQDRAWQFIVLSLVALLAIPSAETLLFRPGEPVVPSPMWRWFVLVLLVVGATNYLATRYWLASLIVLAGQMILILDNLPFQLAGPSAGKQLIGLACLVSAAVLVARGVPRGYVGASPLDQAWIDFRDAFGVVWGMRVAERLRSASSMYGWGVSVTWHGFVMEEGDEIPPEVRRSMTRSLRLVVRRFVSPSWIARRLCDL